MDLRFTLVERNKEPSFLQVIRNTCYMNGNYISYGYVLNTSKDILLAYKRHRKVYEGIDTDLITFLTWTLKREVYPESEEEALQEYIGNNYMGVIINSFGSYMAANVSNYSLAHILQGSLTYLFGIHIEFDIGFWLNQYPYMYILHERGMTLSEDSRVYLCTTSSPDWVRDRFESNLLSIGLPSILLVVHEGILISVLSKELKVGSYWNVLPYVIYTFTNESIGVLNVYKNDIVWEYKPVHIRAQSYKELGDICTKDNPYFDRDKRDRVQKVLKSLRRKGILYRKHGRFWLDD